MLTTVSLPWLLCRERGRGVVDERVAPTHQHPGQRLTRTDTACTKAQPFRLFFFQSGGTQHVLDNNVVCRCDVGLLFFKKRKITWGQAPSGLRVPDRPFIVCQSSSSFASGAQVTPHLSGSKKCATARNRSPQRAVAPYCFRVTPGVPIFFFLL